MDKINHAFAQATTVLFGKSLGPLDTYGEWLGKRVPKLRKLKSCMSGRPLMVPGHSAFANVPEGRVAELAFLGELGKRSIAFDSGDGIGGISKKLPEIAVYITELIQGENADVEESAVYLNLQNACRAIDCFNSKHIAYNFFTDGNDHTFGCAQTFDSNFCIHCYNSRNLNRAFEADACRDCSDIMFCHNCENVRESMFCHNAKNLRHAICNVAVGKEEYARVRDMAVEWNVSELEAKGRLPFDVFDFPCLAKK